MAEDADDAKLRRMARWACEREHNKKRVASVVEHFRSELEAQYGKKAPCLPAARHAVENLVDRIFYELVGDEIGLRVADSEIED